MAPRPGASGLALVLVAATLAGCSGRDPWNRQAVSGFIRVDGQPIGDGAILLEPMAGDRSGLAAGGTIRRGAFRIERDRGPSPGSYRVRIYSSSGVQSPPGKGQTDRTRRPMVERLPETYNTKSTLRLEIVAGGANRLELDLDGKGGD
jgi:hypothetical protein